MRLWSVSRVSALLIVVSAVALAGVPGLRETAWTASREGYGSARVPDPPRDAQDALLLEARATGRDTANLEAAYAQAAQLAPRSAAPALIFARLNSRQLPMNRDEVNVLWPDMPDNLRYHVQVRPLTEEEQGRVAGTRAALDWAARLEPDNAAVEYLRASLSLSAHQDRRAFAELRAMLAKQSWDLHDREVAVAAYEVTRRTASPRQAALATAGVTTVLGSRHYSLVWALHAMALVARARGDEAQAIFLREAGMHLGRLMAARGYSLMEALNGSAVWDLFAADDLTPAEKQAIEGEAAAKASGATARALREAGQAKFAAYLREHGRAGLAAEMTAFAAREADWSQRLQVVTKPMLVSSDRRWILSLVMPRVLRAAAVAIGAVAVLGMIALGFRLARRPARPIRWPRVGWVLAFLGSLGTALGYGALIQMRWQDREWPRAGSDRLFSVVAGPVVGALGLAVVLLPVIALSVVGTLGLAVVLIRRRRHAEARHVGPVRSYVGTLLAVLLPFAALLSLLCLGLAVFTTVCANNWAAAQREVAYQGEMQYLHLQLR
jgi:hypothetical protein